MLLSISFFKVAHSHIKNSSNISTKWATSFQNYFINGKSFKKQHIVTLTNKSMIHDLGSSYVYIMHFITFNCISLHLLSSAAATATVRKRADKLKNMFGRIYM